jgi:hypothetical protein
MDRAQSMASLTLMPEGWGRVHNSVLGSVVILETVDVVSGRTRRQGASRGSLGNEDVLEDVPPEPRRRGVREEPAVVVGGLSY